MSQETRVIKDQSIAAIGSVSGAAIGSVASVEGMTAGALLGAGGSVFALWAELPMKE